MARGVKRRIGARREASVGLMVGQDPPYGIAAASREALNDAAIGRVETHPIE
jgi:hypothetical protein